jgi:acetylornithine/succinyldiaminopimelate/putrescine aminotransferase
MQTKRVIHTSNLYYTIPYTDLAIKLVTKSIFDKVFFCNSGAEANEAVIKLARKHGNKHGSGDKYEIITMKNSFHGRSMATLTATGQPNKQSGSNRYLMDLNMLNLTIKKTLKIL